MEGLITNTISILGISPKVCGNIYIYIGQPHEVNTS